VSSREVRIIDNCNIDHVSAHPDGHSYTIVTGENVVIGHAGGLYPGGQEGHEKDIGAFGFATLFFSWRRACPSLSDSAIVADLINRNLIPGPGPDDN